MRAARLVWCLVFGAGLAASHAKVDWEAYENGKLGPYPQHEYRSTKTISSPLIHVEKLHSDCEIDSYVLLSPAGPNIRGNKAMMVDSSGDLVWFQKELGVVKSLQVQKFKGEEYLTYWVGDDNFPGHGRGFYKMLDKNYQLAYTFGALNGQDGDYHEFTITPQNTAIITAYEKLAWDLSDFGRKDGYIWDCLFQEVDIEKDVLLFEWRASDHFAFTDMSVNSWEEAFGTEQHPWDWFHLNSVQKDPWGHYLIAARYTNAVSYIDGATGRPLWHLGGIQNSFRDLTRGNTTAFVDPHMARWTDAYSAITLFDNVDFRLQQDLDQRRSTAVRISIDTSRRRVVGTIEFFHPNSLFAMAEGSMQRLTNGNYFVGYGSASVYSEFSRDGTLICNANYSPLNFNVSAGEPHQGAVESYRIHKYSWHGDPREPPAIKLSRGKLYVSWNGATHVRAWKVIAQGIASGGVGEWSLMGIFPKTGFETAIELQSDTYSLFRLVALDKSNSTIRSWSIQPEGDIGELYIEQASSQSGNSLGLFSLSFALGCACVLLLLGSRTVSKRLYQITLTLTPWRQRQSRVEDMRHVSLRLPKHQA